MPQLQSVTTYFAINSSNDTSPSGITDPITGQTVYVPDLDTGVYMDVTNSEAASFSYTTNGTLYNGRYRRVKVDSGATASNVKTGTIGIMPSLAVFGNGPTSNTPNGAPGMNVVTSYDQGIGLAADLHPVVFLNAITPGNYGWVQELGVATVLGKNPLTNASPAIGDVIASTTLGVADDPTQSTTLTYALQKLVLGTAIDLPKSNGLYRIQLTLPTLQD